MLTEEGEVIFTTPHFDGYPVVLVQPDLITLTDLEELIIEAWATQAPKRLVREWEKGR